MKIASTLLCGALLAAFSNAAQAQQPEPRTLSRDEFRACLASQDQLKARAEAIKPRVAKLKEEQEAIKAEDDELVKEKEQVEDSNSSFPGKRERFERKVRAHVQRAKASEDEGKALNAEVAQVNKDQDAYNERCGRVSVRPGDRDAVLKEREAAGKK